MTTTVEDAEALHAIVARTGRICAVNYGYSGYPMVREMRAMIARGDLGRVRLVKTEFGHSFHADDSNEHARWRYDPARAGVSGIFGDCGIHALHLASFVVGQEVERLAADFAHCVASRELEDDALVAFRMDGGAVGRLWTSAIALGQAHGLKLQVFGERGGLAWDQEQPNQVYWTPLGEPIRRLERSAHGLSPEAGHASRIMLGHPEGMLEAFANIYSDLAEEITARREGRPPEPAATWWPTSEDGLRSVAAVHAAVESARREGAWVDARPPSLR